MSNAFMWNLTFKISKCRMSKCQIYISQISQWQMSNCQMSIYEIFKCQKDIKPTLMR